MYVGIQDKQKSDYLFVIYINVIAYINIINIIMCKSNAIKIHFCFRCRFSK